MNSSNVVRAAGPGIVNANRCRRCSRPAPREELVRNAGTCFGCETERETKTLDFETDPPSGVFA